MTPKHEPRLLARFLFDRQAASYDADPEEANLIWMQDAGVRAFWVAEAEAVLGFLHPRVSPPGTLP